MTDERDALELLDGPQELSSRLTPDDQLGSGGYSAAWLAREIDGAVQRPTHWA